MCLTKDDDRKGHDGDNDEQPSPSGQAAAAIKRGEQARLDPRSRHAAQMTKDTENGCASTKLRSFVPATVDEMGSNTEIARSKFYIKSQRG